MSTETNPNCPVCGTNVEPTDLRYACPSCSIVFHTECWQENQGCATYGCPKVGELKPPPMKIAPGPAPVAPNPGWSLTPFQNTGSSLPPPVASHGMPPNYPPQNYPQQNYPNYSHPHTASVGNPHVDAMSHANRRKARITFWTVFYTISCLLCYFCGCVLISALDPVLYLVFLLFALAYLYCFCMYLYRLWEEVPAGFARTTPGNAAWFSLIPVFNVFWWFTVFVGLYKDMNKTMKACGIETRFGTAYISLVCVCWLVLYILGLTVRAPLAASLFTFLHVFISIPTLWIVRSRVLEFIDIKMRMGIS